MSFLAPFFLVGLALVAGPVLFHLIRQSPRNRVVFSSTELLEASPPKQQKSRRIQNPWLLIIRCLIIGLLAFAFARPFIPSAANDQTGASIRRDVVIAIDQSASMNRPGISEAVIAEATSIIENLNPEDQLSVFGFTDTIQPFVSESHWSDLPPNRRIDFAIERLQQTESGPFPGLLDNAVIESVSQIEALRERSSESGYGEIYVISDFAEGTSLNQIEGIDWPSALRLRRIPVSSTATGPNLSLRWISWSETDDGVFAQIAISTSDPKIRSVAKITLQNGIDGSLLTDPKEFIVEGQAEIIANIPVDRERQYRPLVFKLEGDQQAYDNQLPIAPPYVPELSIGLLSNAPTTLETAPPYFIAKAVQGFPSPRTRTDEQNPLDPTHAAYLVDRALSVQEAETLRSEIEGGKSAILLADSIEYIDTIRALTENRSWTIADRSDSSALLIGEIDFSHPFFAPFASPRFSNFANINTWQAPELQIPETGLVDVIARFDDGTPLLAEVTIGSGQLFVWAGNWSPQTSQWVLSSKFIPFLHRFVLAASGGAPLPSNVALTRDEMERFETLFPENAIQAQGIYPVPSVANRWVAFHISQQESETTPITEERWDQLGLPEYESSVAQAQIDRLQSSEAQESAIKTEERQHIWQWLLWAVLGLLAVESIVAIKSNQRPEAVS